MSVEIVKTLWPTEQNAEFVDSVEPAEKVIAYWYKLFNKLTAEQKESAMFIGADKCTITYVGKLTELEALKNKISNSVTVLKNIPKNVPPTQDVIDALVEILES